MLHTLPNRAKMFRHIRVPLPKSACHVAPTCRDGTAKIEMGSNKVREACVNHGMFDCFIIAVFLQCFEGVAVDALLECARKVTTNLKTLQKKFGTVPFSQSAVSIDIADMEKLLVAELPISLKCKETLSESSEDLEIVS